MPRRASTENDENVDYIVKGSSPVYLTMAALTFALLIAAIVFQYMELREVYDYPWAIIFESK